MIAERVFEWARRQPSKLAAVSNGSAATYGQFAEAIALARGGLVSRGVGGSGIAAVVATNTLASWTMCLALRSLGVTAAPLPNGQALEELPIDRLGWVVTSGIDFDSQTRAFCAQRNVPLIVLPAGDALPLAIDAGIRPATPGGQLLRTSGTTGRYKLVLIDPAFEAAFLDQRRNLLGLGPESIFNVFNLPTWTGAGYKWVATVFATGGSAIFHDRLPFSDALRIGNQTHAVVIPVLLTELLKAPDGAYPRHPDLQLSISSGAVPWADVERAKARITPHVISRISATETKVFGLTKLETPDDLVWHKPVTGTEVEIVDAEDRPVPPGIQGRLRVSTKGGPQGYFGSPEASRSFFRHGFFYTGDLATMRGDGRFALGGRTTDILNIAGYKIAPGPIEQRLREAWGVTGVCLTSTRQADGTERLCVVIESGTTLEPSRIKEGLDEVLAASMEVSVHYVLALPRNQSGKVVRDQVLQAILGKGESEV